VIGPLPRIYRNRVIAGTILLFVAGGVWLAHSFALPLPFRGVLVGMAFGALIAFALVHDFSGGRQARSLKVTRRH
jgi:hypothetical protein